MPNFNCECADNFYYNETLADLRESLMIDLGYASQVDNIPPGMQAMLDNWLRKSQEFLFRKYPALEQRRYFSWLMDPLNGGERFYGLRDNEEVCDLKLDRYSIEGAWIQDLNNFWHPMYKGIPPTFYTMSDYQGIPSRYDIRQCIEVYPAPAEAYTLWIRGLFGLRRFTEDGDFTTIDSELVRLWALARAKAHYAKPDARAVRQEALEYLGTIVAGTHAGQRYIPGVEPLPPETPPIFLPLVNP
jgi:hypothetical protein